MIQVLQSAILAQIISEQNIKKSGIPLNPLTNANIDDGIRIFLGVAGAVAVIMITYGGLKYVISQGNPQEVSKAKNAIIDGLIGLGLVVTSFGIVSFVLFMLG